MGGEVWKDLPGFLGYQVSNLGKVRSCRVRRNQWKSTMEFSSTWKELFPCRHGKSSSYLVLTAYTASTPSEVMHFKMHRLVWELFVGPIPSSHCIDHINNDGSDNRLENLRLANNSTNHMNQKPRNSRKFKGIWKNGNKFCSTITLNGVRNYLGSFGSAEEAARAYNNAAKKLFGEYARLNPAMDA